MHKQAVSVAQRKRVEKRNGKIVRGDEVSAVDAVTEYAIEVPVPH
jgi:hypothetical protein